MNVLKKIKLDEKKIISQMSNGDMKHLVGGQMLACGGSGSSYGNCC